MSFFERVGDWALESLCFLPDVTEMTEEEKKKKNFAVLAQVLPKVFFLLSLLLLDECKYSKGYMSGECFSISGFCVVYLIPYEL